MSTHNVHERNRDADDQHTDRAPTDSLPTNTVKDPDQWKKIDELQSGTGRGIDH